MEYKGRLRKLSHSSLMTTMAALFGESISSLLSAIITLYTLIILYFPQGIIFSPVLISASVLLFSLLRLGTAQRISRVDPENCLVAVENRRLSLTPQSSLQCNGDPGHDPTPCPVPYLDPNSDPFYSEPFVEWVDPGNTIVSVGNGKLSLTPPSSLQSSRDSRNGDPGHDPDPCYDPKSDPLCSEHFVEWDVRAPLEIIYEEFEGQGEEENGDVLEGRRAAAEEAEEMGCLQRYASLSRYYPDTDSDTSSEGDFPVIGDWDSPETMCFRWEEDREELIEIELDGKRIACDLEEDNLIEIDLSPAR